MKRQGALLAIVALAIIIGCSLGAEYYLAGLNNLLSPITPNTSNPDTSAR